MYTFTLQNFLNQVLITDSLEPPSIQTTVVIDGANENEVAIAACNMMPTIFNFLNECNGTNYRYPDYYSINPDTGSGTDHIIMIESGIEDTPYLKQYIISHCISVGQNVGGL
jgi:hypothetical protein